MKWGSKRNNQLKVVERQFSLENMQLFIYLLKQSQAKSHVTNIIDKNITNPKLSPEILQVIVNIDKTMNVNKYSLC